MLGAVVEEYSAINAPGGNEVGVERIVARLINFAGVVDFLRDVEHKRAFGSAMSTNLLQILVVFGSIGAGFLKIRYFDRRNLDIVLVLSIGIGAYQHAMLSVLSSGDRFCVWKPLRCERRPV